MAAPPPKASHPGRTLIIFMLVVVALGGLMFAFDSSPTPRLGLDLAGRDVDHADRHADRGRGGHVRGAADRGRDHPISSRRRRRRGVRGHHAGLDHDHRRGARREPGRARRAGRHHRGAAVPPGARDGPGVPTPEPTDAHDHARHDGSVREPDDPTTADHPAGHDGSRRPRGRARRPGRARRRAGRSVQSRPAPPWLAGHARARPTTSTTTPPTTTPATTTPPPTTPADHAVTGGRPDRCRPAPPRSTRTSTAPTRPTCRAAAPTTRTRRWRRATRPAAQVPPRSRHRARHRCHRRARRTAADRHRQLAGQPRVQRRRRRHVRRR